MKNLTNKTNPDRFDGTSIRYNHSEPLPRITKDEWGNICPNLAVSSKKIDVQIFGTGGSSEMHSFFDEYGNLNYD